VLIEKAKERRDIGVATDQGTGREREWRHEAVRRRQRDCDGLGPPPRQPVGVHRRGDVLHGVLALVLEPASAPLAQRAAHRLGHRDATRLGQRLKARSDVHPVPVHRAVGLLDDVPQMNPDAKSHSTVFIAVNGRGRKLLLNREGCADRTSSGVEHCKHRVTCGVDDMPAVISDALLEHFACRIQRGKSRALVSGHQTRVAGHVGGNNRHQPMPQACVAHAAPPSLFTADGSALPHAASRRRTLRSDRTSNPPASLPTTVA
jgi:hypothetical protein